MADLRVENHGSLVLLYPESDAGRDWVEEHLPAERMTWGPATVVEPRYVSDIVDGARNDGLEVM